MKHDTHSPVTDLLQQPRTKLLLLAVSGFMVLLALLLIYLAVAGFGSLQVVGVPSSDAITLNGHSIKPGTLKLRPGDYELLVTAPTIMPFESILHISLFGQQVIKPNLQARSADAIASSLIGAIPGTAIPPHLTNLQWFDGNMWAAGILSPTDTVLVMHYDDAQKQWVTALCNNPGYPDDPSVLPPDVAAFVQPLLQGGV